MKKNQKQCVSCGRFILFGDYFLFTDKHIIFCRSCEATQHCFSCRLPVGIESISLNDGRKICRRCKAAIIFTDEKLNEITKSIYNYVSKYLRIELPDNVKIQLVDLKKFRSFSRNKNTRGLFSAKGSNKNIYILSGMQTGDTVAIMAHELVHAWQYDNKLINLPNIDIEGFAEWIAYKVVSELNFLDSCESIKNNYYKEYRKGFEKYAKLEKEVGAQGIINKVINQSK